MTLKNALAYHIPMTSTLKTFLELPHVFDNICNHQNKILTVSKKENCLLSLINTSFWQTVIEKYPPNDIVFPLVLYFDDFETINPLGSHAGCHKMGVIYFTIPTIPPAYSSRLENIFFGQIFYSEDRARYGNKKTFQPVIEEFKYLESTGIVISIGENTYNVKFVLASICGNNLGLHAILGFNESFSSIYFCRFCTEKKENMKIAVVEQPEKLSQTSDYE